MSAIDEGFGFTVLPEPFEVTEVVDKSVLAAQAALTRVNVFLRRAPSNSFPSPQEGSNADSRA